jgi:hypothetical protein
MHESAISRFRSRADHPTGKILFYCVNHAFGCAQVAHCCDSPDGRLTPFRSQLKYVNYFDISGFGEHSITCKSGLPPD